MFADLPPSSRNTRFSVSAPRAAMCLPTAVEPVNEIMSTSGEPVSTSPTAAGSAAVTTLNTPGGDVGLLGDDLADPRGRVRRVGRGLQHHRAARGERGRDLREVQHEREVPRRDRADDTDRLADRRAGSSSCRRTRGCRARTPTRSDRSWSMSHCMSSMQVSCWIANVRPIGVPTSATICGRSSSLCLSSASFSCCRHALRNARSVDQVVSSNARRAAAMARSMSAGEASATGPMTVFGRGVDVVVGAAALGLDQLAVDQHPRFERQIHCSVPSARWSAQGTRVGSVLSDAHRRARPRIELLPPPRRRRAPRRHVHRRRPREGDAAPRRRRRPPRPHPAGPTADRAVAAVRRLRQLADALGAREVIAKATSAIRTAANGSELVDRIEAETGVEVEVINGNEEARLVFAAVRASVVLEPAPALCIDVGGGSVEIMIGDAAGPALGDEPPARRRPPHRRVRARRPAVEGRPQAARRTRARRARTARRRGARAARPRLAVGTSGTLNDLVRMAVALESGERTMPAEHERAARDARRHRSAARAHHGRRRRRSGGACPASRNNAAPSCSPPVRRCSSPRSSCSTSTG